MASYADVAKRWTEIVLGRTDARPLKADRMPIYGDKIYSYGSHFELARLVTPKTGAPFFLLNGDTYSVTTARHQREIRAAVDATGVPSVIVPHSALHAAGIEPDSIVPVAVDAERTEKTRHTLTLPDGMANALLARAEDQCRDAVAGLRLKLAADGAEYSYAYGTASGTAEGVTPDGTRVFVTIYGASYSHAMVPHTRPDGSETTVSEGWVIRPENEWRANWYYGRGHGLERIDGNTFAYDRYRHFLGASVFRATVREYRERETARVLASEDDGSAWTSGVSRSEVREGFMGTGQTWNVYRVKDPRKRHAYFVSAFDNETGRGQPLYFLAELPAKTLDGKPYHPADVADALESLQPFGVAVAIRAGADVKRQGDIFAVPCKAAVDAHPIPFRFPDKRRACPLDGTSSHVATELVTFPNGRVFARGTLTHTRGEHKRLSLGKEWHELIRNRVPLNRPNVHPDSRESGRMRAVADTPRAWTIHGRID